MDNKKMANETDQIDKEINAEDPKEPRKPKDMRPKSTKKTMLRLASYLLKYKARLIVTTIFIILNALSNVAGTYMLMPIINDGILPMVGKEPSPAVLGPFLKLFSILAVIYLIGTVSSYIFARIMITVSNKTLNAVRTDLFDRLEELPIAFFDTHTHGELMSRFSGDVDVLRECISNGMYNLIFSGISLLATFIMMIILSPILTVLIVVMMGVMILIITFVGKKSAKYFKEQQKANGICNGYIEELIEGQKVVKVFCREEAVSKEFAKKNDTLRKAAAEANTYGSVIMPIMGNISYFNYALTAMLGAFLVIWGKMDIGSISAFLQYTRNFSQPVTQFSQQINSILAAMAGAERIFEVIDTPPERDDGYVTLVNADRDANNDLVETTARTGIWAWRHPHQDGKVTYTPLNGFVEFEDVDFSYDGKKTVLHNFTLTAQPGEKIAFVGSTGAGKTTITNLLNRFYEISGGKIRYDGINITKIKKDDLRRSLAMVLQDTHLFTGSVTENIKYGWLDATDQQVRAAAQLANAHFFITHLPNGYDTMLTSDGANLSGGQRQLISIARSAVADPPVLVLDEATSSIDTRTEALIEKGMNQLMKGRTVFVIAHRLSTVKNADKIVVLEQGRIAEQGNHDDLIAQKGRYYQLYTGMFELE